MSRSSSNFHGRRTRLPPVLRPKLMPCAPTSGSSYRSSSRSSFALLQGTATYPRSVQGTGAPVVRGKRLGADAVGQHLGVQLPPGQRQDWRVRGGGARACPTHCGGARQDAGRLQQTRARGSNMDRAAGARRAGRLRVAAWRVRRRGFTRCTGRTLERRTSARPLTTHFDLDFPAPDYAPYYCYKHKRTCRPVETAAKFLSRYTTDTCRRIRAFGEVRTNASVTVLHGDTRAVRLMARGRWSARLRRIPGSSITTSSTGTPTSCSAWRSARRGDRRGGDGPAQDRAHAIRRRVERGIRQCHRTARAGRVGAHRGERFPRPLPRYS